MRKIIALICVILLLPLPLVKGEQLESPTPAPTLTPEEWANKSLPYKRLPEHIEIVPMEELPPVNEGQHHYLLLCIDHWVRDARPDDAKPPTQKKSGRRRDMYGNTDGIVLVTLDTRARRIMLTSIIRDAIVRKITSTDKQELFGRINYIYNDNGPEALCQTISQHLGVKIEKYILFTFKQIANIVDYMGGVEIELSDAEVSALKYTVLRGTVTDSQGRDLQDRNVHAGGLYTFKTTDWAEAQNVKTEKEYKNKPDKVIKRTGGCSAVLYMRIRKFGGGGDFMRTQRARNVLSLLAEKCRNMTWDDAQALANNILENNNKTNMNLNDMLEAAKYAFELRGCTIEELRIPQEGAVRRIQFASMAAEELNWPLCREAFQNYLQTSFLVADDDPSENSIPLPESGDVQLSLPSSSDGN